MDHSARRKIYKTKGPVPKSTKWNREKRKSFPSASSNRPQSSSHECLSDTVSKTRGGGNEKNQRKKSEKSIKIRKFTEKSDRGRKNLTKKSIQQEGAPGHHLHGF